ncbi:conserved Plasmodium protein, unknown function [Plasmodium sp. gorilla clade G1]|nr:conserved Plasmodium protein, unknown function [Plasmodium sp. gorilla clade G1]
MELIDAGCFISQMNELLLIDPLYINYVITNYFNNYINDKNVLLPQEGLNGVYFENAKAGLWSSFAIREKTSFSSYNMTEEGYGNNSTYNMYSNKGYNNEMVHSFICFNNSELMHQYLTIDKINELNWKTYEVNNSNVGIKKNDNKSDHINDNDDNKNDNKNDHINDNDDNKSDNMSDHINDNSNNNKYNNNCVSKYFTNILTIEGGQVGLFCVESIKKCSNILLEKHAKPDINSKEELDILFNKNMNNLYPWYNKICNMTLSSSITIIDFIDMPIGSVCVSSSDCVFNYLCEVVTDDITGEIWAIRVNFLNPLK